MEPNPLAILGLCVVGAGALIFLLWLNHQWATRKERRRGAMPRSSAIWGAVSYVFGGSGGNHYMEDDDDLMSRAHEEMTEKASSSLQTDTRRDQDQTEDPRVRRAKMLDTYRILRRHGMSRADARTLLSPWGIP